MENFPDIYYQETDPQKRWAILTEAKKEDESSQNCTRERLFHLRYKKPDKEKGGQWTDAYIKLWMELKFAAQYVNSFFGGRSARKGVRRLLENLEIARILEEGEEARELLYQEFYHAARVYLKLCSSDRNYTSSFMGMVPLKEDSVQTKIARDVYESLYVGMKFAQAEEELYLLRQAAKAAFDDYLPAQREYLQEMIDRRKKEDE